MHPPRLRVEAGLLAVFQAKRGSALISYPSGHDFRLVGWFGEITRPDRSHEGHPTQRQFLPHLVADPRATKTFADKTEIVNGNQAFFVEFFNKFGSWSDPAGSAHHISSTRDVSHSTQSPRQCFRFWVCFWPKNPQRPARCVPKEQIFVLELLIGDRLPTGVAHRRSGG